MKALDSYVIHGGVLYDVADAAIEEAGENTIYSATLASPQYLLAEVLTDIRLSAHEGIFLPRFGDGHVVAHRGTPSNNDGVIVCIEYPPAVRWLSFYEDDVVISLKMAFPYVYLVVGAVPGQIEYYPYYRNTPVSSLDDMLCYSNLFNTDKSGRCRGGYNHAVEEQVSVLAALGMAVNEFWTNQYTDSLTDLWVYAKTKIRRHPSSIVTWAIRSRLPGWRRFITSLSWMEAHSLRVALDKMAKNYGG